MKTWTRIQSHESEFEFCLRDGVLTVVARVSAAFVTLTIIDEAVHENSIRMWAKWELMTAVKHYRDRRSIES
jgi:hypothetical protein